MALLLFIPLIASAQRPPRREAAQLARKGSAHFEAGAYDDALAEFRAANELDPRPILLYNIGQCLRKKGDGAGAIEAYRAYLTLDPNGRAAAEAHEHIAALQKDRVVDERPPAPPPPPPATLLPAPLPAAARPAAAEPPSPRRRSGMRVVALSSGAAGVVAIGLGAIFAVQARAAADDVDHVTRWDPDLYARGQSAQRNAIFCFGAGGAALAAGALLYWFSGREDGSPRPAPVVAPGTVGLSIAGRFE